MLHQKDDRLILKLNIYLSLNLKSFVSLSILQPIGFKKIKFVLYKTLQRPKQEDWIHGITAQKMKLSSKDIYRKYDLIWRKLRIWSHLLKKSWIGNLSFCAVCMFLILMTKLFNTFLLLDIQI